LPNPAIHDLLDNTAAVTTNGRKDGFNHQPSQLYTYMNKSMQQQSLIDYIIMSTDMIKRVSSQRNTNVYNGTIKTDHALSYVPLRRCADRPSGGGSVSENSNAENANAPTTNPPN
jgi:hypothetical protein